MSDSASAARTYESLQTGETASFERTITDVDVGAFATFSGDTNELHTDAAYAKEASFRDTVVHGMLLGAFVSRVVGMQLPGRYSLLVKETLEFKKPVIVGDTITVRATITHKSDATRIVHLSIDIRKQDDVVAEGSVRVRVLQ